MSQSVHVRPGAIKYIAIFVAILVAGGSLYWALDRYIINPEVSFENIDAGSLQVTFTTAPQFILPDLNSQAVDVSHYQDKIVIVNFWASWCGPCIEEFPSLMKYVDQFKGEVVLLAVSQDNNIDNVHQFLKNFKVEIHPSFHVLLDLDRRVGKSYGVGALPESFLFSKKLKFERKIVGFRDWMSPSSINEVMKLIDANRSL